MKESVGAAAKAAVDVSPAETLLALAERCERLRNYDGDTDMAIMDAVCEQGRLHSQEHRRTYEWHFGGLIYSAVPEFTRSIDAALTLVPEGAYSTSIATAYRSVHVSPIDPDSYGISDPRTGRCDHAATVALAICAAALKARARALVPIPAPSS